MSRASWKLTCASLRSSNSKRMTVPSSSTLSPARPFCTIRRPAVASRISDCLPDNAAGAPEVAAWAGVRLAGHAVLANADRLEVGAEAEVVFVQDGVVLVVVAVSAVEGQAEKRLADVLDVGAHPVVGVQRVPVADQEAGRHRRL